MQHGLHERRNNNRPPTMWAPTPTASIGIISDNLLVADWAGKGDGHEAVSSSAMPVCRLRGVNNEVRQADRTGDYPAVPWRRLYAWITSGERKNSDSPAG